MAEKTNDMKQFNAADPVSAMSGAQIESPTDRTMSRSTSSLEQREMETNVGEHPPETEHLKSQIEATRSQMGETIDAIQQKLSVENISNEVSTRVSDAIDQAKQTAYDATIGKATRFMKKTSDQISGSKAASVARDNPIPLVLLGVGAGWLAYSAFSSRGSGARDRQYQLRDGNRDRRQSARTDRGAIAETYREGMAKASDAASSAYNEVSGAVSGAYSSASDLANRTYENATDIANRTYETAGEYAHAAKAKYSEYVESNPLAIGALAFAAGAAVGFAFPSTQIEGQIMGATREKVLNKAQSAAGDLLDRTKQIAEENRRPLTQSGDIVH